MLPGVIDGDDDGSLEEENTHTEENGSNESEGGDYSSTGATSNCTSMPDITTVSREKALEMAAHGLNNKSGEYKAAMCDFVQKNIGGSQEVLAGLRIVVTDLSVFDAEKFASEDMGGMSGANFSDSVEIESVDDSASNYLVVTVKYLGYDSYGDGEKQDIKIQYVLFDESKISYLLGGVNITFKDKTKAFFTDFMRVRVYFFQSGNALYSYEVSEVGNYYEFVYFSFDREYAPLYRVVLLRRGFKMNKTTGAVEDIEREVVGAFDLSDEEFEQIYGHNRNIINEEDRV